MPFAHTPRPGVLASLAHAAPSPFWLEEDARCPDPAPTLTEKTSADLVVVGGGFTGLWTALLAKDAHPTREVILLEASTSASGATGRNGGFVAASLTHGFENGLNRWPRELARLIALGHANLDAIEQTVARFKIDCDFVRSGELLVAVEPYQVETLRALPARANPYGEHYRWLDVEQTRALVNSPTYLGAVHDPAGVAMVNPARLAWGLRAACVQLGVRLYEHTPALKLDETPTAIHIRTPYGAVRAAHVALATNAYPPLLRRLSYYMVPVYDYVLMTEPLNAEQRAAVRWPTRLGVSDTGNQFHYYRMTEDGRMLWGGYDALYHWNNGFGAHLENNPAAFGRLADHFFQTFPQLTGVCFTHAWGGAIDTSSRFSAFWGTAHRGRTAYALGYTGLGVGASRFGAQVLLDLLDRRTTERTALEMTRTHPIPFPPEPVRSLGIYLTQWSLDHADHHAGRRNLWLQLLDKLGLGFDS